MKSFIKICASTAALLAIAFFGASTVEAAATFSPMSGFDSVTRISNYTDCPGCVTWDDDSVSGHPNDEVTIDVTIYNTGSTASTSTRVSISPKDTSAALSHSRSGKIYSGSVLAKSDSASVSVTGGTAQTLTYLPYTFKYYPAGCTSATCVQTTPPMGGSVEDLFTSGINIGTVAPGDAPRHIQARFRIGNTVVVDEPECSNDIDDDGDGLIDYGSSASNDPGCSSSSDDTEYNSTSSSTGPSVSTEDASDIDEDSATLEGHLDSLGSGSYANVHFKWGDESDELTHTVYPSPSTLYSTGDFHAFISGLDADEDYCFQAVASNGYGTDYGSVECFDTHDEETSDDIDVTTKEADNVEEDEAELVGDIDNNDDGESLEVYFYMSDDEDDDVDDLIDDGDKIDADDDFDGNGEFSEVVDGLDADTDYFYIACFEDEDGDEECGSIKDFTTDDDEEDEDEPEDTITFDLPFVVTTVVTNVTGSSAKLNGLLTDDGNSFSTGWFEWGGTGSLGLRTSDQTLGIGDGLAFGNYIFGLSPNTTYYYRACARNNGGTACGDVLSFRTVSTVNPGPIVTPAPTVVAVGTGGGNPFVMLEITSPYVNACPTDSNDYTVSYKNISGRTLTDVVLRVTLPEEVVFRKASAGQFTDGDNTLTVDLDDLSPGEEGEIFLSGDVTIKAADEEVLVATAIIAFTFANNSGQEEAIDFYSHDVTECGNRLGAFALFGGDFFPHTLAGWILLILLILALIYLGRKIAESRRRPYAPVYAPHAPRSVNDLPH